ncbi:MAG TPA: GNAT family N-acetyltransferase [Candidatus Dormibacteraeota bacterium]|jgi:GNAT superfamily N-acetyltransferase|nr:GNAT family N-acetyltransferase [Candidatus Dormibacteraeota bacterium]
MQLHLGDGYELDDDRARVDVAAVHRYLSEQAYWAQGRPYEVVEQQLRDAYRVVGLYRGDAQVGYCRTNSDGVAIAYLADVYVLPADRGRGLGVQLVREAIVNGPAVARWMLHTSDAHALYAKFGFRPPSDRAMELERRNLIDPLGEPAAQELDLELGID